MENQQTKVPLKLQVDLSGIEPSPKLQEFGQTYLTQLCEDLSIPVSAAVSVQPALPNQAWAPGFFRITINTRTLRSRCYPLPTLRDTPDPPAIAADLLAMALYEGREFLVTPELVDYLKQDKDWHADRWSKEALIEFLHYFGRYNFSFQLAKKFMGSDALFDADRDNATALLNMPVPFLFEQAIESSLTTGSGKFGIEIGEGPQSLAEVVETCAGSLGIFIPKLRILRQTESQPQQLELRINDVRLPKIRTLESGDMAGRIRQTMIANAGSLLAAPIVHLMIEQIWWRSSNLVASFEQKFNSLGAAHLWLTAVFRKLLDEIVPIRDLPRILESLLGLREITVGSKKEVHYFSERPDCPLRITSGMLRDVTVDNLASVARLGMHSVSENTVDNGSIQILRLTQHLEKSLAGLDGRPVTFQLAAELSEYLGPQLADSIAIVVSQSDRAAIKSSLRLEFPRLPVFGRAEIARNRYAAACAGASQLLFDRRTGPAAEGLQMAAQATLEEPLEISYHDNLGEIQDRLGDHKNAREQYRIVLALAADDPQPLMNIADTYFQKLQYDSAMRVYRQIAEKFGRPEQYELLASKLYYIGSWTRSIEAHRTAIDLDPQNAYYRANLGGALTSQGDYVSAADRKHPLHEEAIQRFTEAIEIENKVGWFYWRRSWPLLRLAGLDANREKADQLMDRAEQDLLTAIELDVQSKVTLSLELAHLLGQREKFEQATRLLLPLRDEEGSRFQVGMELAKVFALAEHFEEGCHVAANVIRSLEKPDAEAERILQILREGFAITAKVRNEPPNALFEAQLGSVQSRLNNLDAALRHYRRASELDRSSTEYRKQLGNILYKQGALDPAVQEWLQAGEEPLTLNNLGTAYDGLGDLAKAALYYRRAREKMKDNFVPWYNLGSVHYRLEQWDLSREEYAAAIEKNPQFAPAYLNRGNCFYRLNQAQDAEKDWREAIHLDSNLNDAYFNLGVLLWRSEQRREEALQYWRDAWLKDTNFTRAEDNFLAAREGREPKLEIADLKQPRI